MSKTSKTTQTNSPPAWAAPAFQKSGEDAMKLYNSGTGGNTYTGSTVAPLSGTTMSGINQLANAGANWNTAGTRPLYQGLGAAATMNPATNRLFSAANDASGPTSAATNLQDYASGKYLDPASNPYFSKALQDQLDNTAATVQSQFAGAGRYGSGANTGELTKQLGQLSTSAMADQFAREQANQFAATNQIDTSGQNQLALQGNLLSNAGQQYSTGIGQGLQSADAMRGLDQQNFQNRLTGAGATLQAGGLLDTQAQKQLADQVAKWYSLDNQDWTRLGMLQTAAAGAAGPYGTQVATSRQPVGVGGILGGLGSLMGKG